MARHGGDTKQCFWESFWFYGIYLGFIDGVAVRRAIAPVWCLLVVKFWILWAWCVGTSIRPYHFFARRTVRRILFFSRGTHVWRRSKSEGTSQPRRPKLQVPISSCSRGEIFPLPICFLIADDVIIIAFSRARKGRCETLPITMAYLNSPADDFDEIHKHRRPRSVNSGFFLSIPAPMIPTHGWKGQLLLLDPWLRTRVVWVIVLTTGIRCGGGREGTYYHRLGVG